MWKSGFLTDWNGRDPPTLGGAFGALGFASCGKNFLFFFSIIFDFALLWLYNIDVDALSRH